MVVEAASKLEKLGAKVERVSIPDVLLAPDLWMVSRREGYFDLEAAWLTWRLVDDTADLPPRSSPA
jgi:hypothetical protein